MSRLSYSYTLFYFFKRFIIIIVIEKNWKEFIFQIWIVVITKYDNSNSIIVYEQKLKSA